MGSNGVRRPRLVELARGVADPEQVADFLGEVLDLVPVEADGGAYSLPASNGALRIHGDTSSPVSLTFASAGTGDDVVDADPDGVHVEIRSGAAPPAGAGGVVLDHVALSCGGLAPTAAFYERLGFVETWSSPGEAVHVSGADGYLALCEDGPPAFLHIGLAVDSLAKITQRLDGAGIPYLRGSSTPVGERIYLHDTDGDASRGGRNVELVEYRPGVTRSGKLP